jgi:ribosomal protein S27AE
MSPSEKVEIAPCPKCGKPIWSDHRDPWCHKCGEYFLADFRAKIPRLADRGVQVTQPAAEEVISDSKAMQSASPRARAVMMRYRDSYRVASVIVSVGDTIKGVGLVLAVILAIVGFIATAEHGILPVLTGLLPAVS